MAIVEDHYLDKQILAGDTVASTGLVGLYDVELEFCGIGVFHFVAGKVWGTANLHGWDYMHRSMCMRAWAHLIVRIHSHRWPDCKCHLVHLDIPPV